MKSRTGKWVGSFILQEERKRNRWPRPKMGQGIDSLLDIYIFIISLIMKMSNKKES